VTFAVLPAFVLRRLPPRSSEGWSFVQKSRLLASLGIFLVGGLLACLPGEPVPPTFTLAFGGDVMLGRGVAQSLGGDWETAFSAVRPWLAETDLTFANLESPLTTAPQMSSGYDLRATPAAVAALHVAGFDVVSLANNHALDAGEVGLAETVATLDAAGIAGVVTQTTGDLRQSVRYHLLAFDDSTVPLDVEIAARSVAAAAAEADPVIVSVHWGGEYQAAPSPRQQLVAQALAHAGADLVIGHGPHVLQRVEWRGKTLVAYSLGNLLFDQPYPLDCRQGVILRVTRSVRGGSLAFELLPTVVERGHVRPANAQEAQTILARLQP
jgi:poly-gamma-glutamate capsule biosynthesis protein CapA/YwtB (metallophosphatase superfamily)